MKDEEFFSSLRPELAVLAQVHRRACAAAGISLIFTAGFRSQESQMLLYEKGRAWVTGIGWHVIAPHLIVTNATPEHAPHCRGAAYDCAPVDEHERIDWSNHALFDAVARFAPHGLVWGGSWPRLKDLPHYELPDWRTLPLRVA